MTCYVRLFRRNKTPHAHSTLFADGTISRPKENVVTHFTHIESALSSSTAWSALLVFYPACNLPFFLFFWQNTKLPINALSV
jgi:hypothetical protein